MPQFKEENPTFYEEYFKSRLIVTHRGRIAKAEKKTETESSAEKDTEAKTVAMTKVDETAKRDETPKTTKQRKKQARLRPIP